MEPAPTSAPVAPVATDTPTSAGPVKVVPRPARPFVPYVPAIGPKLRVLLLIVFALFAFLGATGIYLGAVSLLNYAQSPVSYTTPFALWVFLSHIALGVLGTVPFLVFGAVHWASARTRPNRVAVRLGVILFVAGLLVCLSGFALVQLDGLPQLPTGSVGRAVVYWLHIVLPAGAVWAYIAHRRAGPRIKWRLAKVWGAGVGVFTVGMVAMHAQDPQKWFREGPKEGAKYFEPSMTRTADGKFINADVMMMDAYCAKCHQDVANDHFHSAHKFSSFNNPAYLFSVRETRKNGMDKVGSVKSSRWCAGCHDPVPFLSGAFDDPNFDDVNHKTAHAGITCTVCHAMTHVNGTFGNGAYTLEEPAHYPFARSENKSLQWINQQLVKAKPDFHKQTFLKPFHKSAEFCATCHKVSLPVELNQYKEFLRGQNHYDSFLLSGVSGHGTRSFYYPPQAKHNCAECHMPLKPSNDFGAKDFDKSGKRTVHNHRFPGANTGLFELLKTDPKFSQHAQEFQKTVDMHTDFLKGTAADGSDKKVRIDIFGLKPGTLDTAGLVQLRPDLPALQPGKTYIVEVVVRTLGLGHHFSQGTVDSNEIWVDFRATAGGVEIARNGAVAKPDESGEVDRWAHFINVHMLDREGNRINRRNPQDIYTPLYDKQIPPGAAAVMHYRIDVPATLTAPIELTARLRYRKFDYEYMKLVHGGKEPPKLPIVDMAEDTVTLPVAGGPAVPAQASPIKPLWQRWNDYGIGNLLEGPSSEMNPNLIVNRKGYLRQAESAFKTVLALNDPAAAPHARLNLARTYLSEGRINEAAQQLDAAGKCDPPAPAWSRAWFTAQANTATATRKEHIDAVIADLEKLLDPATQPRDRGFDFTRDYVVWNFLAKRLFERRQFEPAGTDARRDLVLRSVKAAERVLELDAEDVAAHDQLALAYAELATGPLPLVNPTDVSPDWVLNHAAIAADPKRPAQTRIESSALVAAGLSQLALPRLATMRDVIAKLRAAHHAETSAEVRAALAGALAKYHRESHTTYKPDESARPEATRKYREKNPAANYAARDRVVYPTTAAHRDAILKTGELPK